jgi:hypothetical protein
MRAMLYEAAQILLVRSAKWSWLKAWAMKIARHSRVKPSTIASPLPPVGSTDDPTRDLGSRDRIAEVLSAAGARPPVRVRRGGMLTEQPALVCARPSTVGRHERGRQ